MKHDTGEATLLLTGVSKPSTGEVMGHFGRADGSYD